MNFVISILFIIFQKMLKGVLYYKFESLA